jgi:hypothetical protein
LLIQPQSVQVQVYAPSVAVAQTPAFAQGVLVQGAASSQFSPLKPPSQAQVYAPVSSMQPPAFWQGALSHTEAAATSSQSSVLMQKISSGQTVPSAHW